MNIHVLYALAILFLLHVDSGHAGEEQRRGRQRNGGDRQWNGGDRQRGSGGGRRREQRKGSSSSLALERSSRGLVPQLLPNYTEPVLPPAEDVSCGMSFVACAYRAGCGLALQQYERTCDPLVTGLTAACSRPCQHALIALLSTEEGKRLMACQCEDDDCRLKKARIEPCRAAVTWQSSPSTLVSCSAATWICLADPLCAKALDYYNLNCQAMFKGRRCSKKCRNSLDILLRQDAAGKLATCYCDGSEDFECAAIRDNTDTLCFGKKKVDITIDKEEEVDNTIEGASAAGRRSRPLWTAVVSVLVSFWIPNTIGSLRELLIVTL